MRLKSSAFALVCAPLIAAAQPRSAAVDTARAAETFVHESWTVEDGLPVNSVNAILQSRDGYIWLATFDGLVRFDGVRFTVYNSANTKGLPTNRITRLRESGDGALWLVTESSQLIRFRDGVFTQFDAAHGLSQSVISWFVDTAGSLWVGTTGGVGPHAPASFQFK